jgi:esterase/lipase superfamily enzyme
MNREYHKWYSPSLGRDMELLVFGHAGLPVIVFPTSMGRFFDYENRHMISIIGEQYERGQIQAFCVDSVDAESWYNKSIHPAQRAARHEQYDHYLVNEVVPFIRSRNSLPELTVTGCSFGGYHSANFALKHPQLVTEFISMGGAFDIHQFLDGYYDDTCYYNCPPDFLPNLNDPAVNRMNIILAAGEYDICRAENERLSRILASKGIAHTLDIWGDGAGHDWPWWQAMVVKFL